jgi:hypothetical protein
MTAPSPAPEHLVTFDAYLCTLDRQDLCERASAMRHEVRRRLAREAAVVVYLDCPTCRRSLPEDAFNVHRRRPSGRQWQCKPCRDEARRRQDASRRNA